MTTPGGACLLPLPLPDSRTERSVLFAVRRMAAHGVRDVSAAWLILDLFSTGFRRVESCAELQLRGRRFVEPPPDAPAAARGDVDVVLVPALAVTPDGHRLGFGVGFYDATLPDVAPPAVTIALAFSFQLLGELFIEPHDVACDLIVTDSEIIDPRGRLATTRSAG